ncbi:formyl transferase-like protein [Hoeflea marina]|uniref:Formyl transferase-like protein n=2 Tax=Hoeflea marina TaxID=274592 RepID=A0A317PIT8_9HYPH|nr:formyl transferase-like protein [Hoeflea marina]
MVAERSLLGAAIAEEWLAQGNRIAAIWTSDHRRLRPNLLERIGAAVTGLPTLSSIARRHGIPIRQIGRLSRMPDLEREVRATGADVLMTVMTHSIVPEAMLALFDGRAINCHPALLPHFKGPQPLQSMLHDGCGEVHGGLTLHVLSPGIDEGAIVAQQPLPLRVGEIPEWNALSVLAVRRMMRGETAAYLRGDRQAVPQQPGSGHYRRVAAGEFSITADKSLALCQHLSRTIPPGTLLWLPAPADAARRGSYRIAEALRRIGPATGRTPRIGWLTIEADVTDARIAMRRRHKIAEIVARIGESLRMRRVLARAARAAGDGPASG